MKDTDEQAWINGVIAAIRAEKAKPPEQRTPKLLQKLAKELVDLQCPYVNLRPCNDPPAHGHKSRSPSFGRWPHD